MKSLTRQGAKPMTLNVLATLARLPGAMKRRSTPTHAKARKHVAPPAVPQLNKLRGLKLLKAAAHRVGLCTLRVLCLRLRWVRVAYTLLNASVAAVEASQAANHLAADTQPSPWHRPAAAMDAEAQCL